MRSSRGGGSRVAGTAPRVAPWCISTCMTACHNTGYQRLIGTGCMTSQLAAPLYIYLRACMAFVGAVVFDLSLAQPGRMWIQKRGTREAPPPF